MQQKSNFLPKTSTYLITYDIFSKWSEEDKRNYIERKQADIDVVNGLINDRIIYRRVVDKLTKQLVNAGLKPCTDYFKESDYRRS